MLVLSRRLGEEIIIDSHIRVTVLSVTGGRVRIGIAAPDDIAVDRAEVHNRRMGFVIDKVDGDCVVGLTDAGKRVAGQFSAMHDGRIYLFPDEGSQKKFLADPKKYAMVDVAIGGNCAVCAKMMKKEMPGKAEFTSVYKGQRYFFPSAKERTMFDADPASFVGKDMKLGAAPPVKPDAVAVTGKTACAGCAYSVRPITDADSLGIAVVAGDKVYVVEGGEKRYPDLFKARFDGVPVELKGTVKKSQGKFVWVEPTLVTKLR